MTTRIARPLLQIFSRYPQARKKSAGRQFLASQAMTGVRNERLPSESVGASTTLAAALAWFVHTASITLLGYHRCHRQPAWRQTWVNRLAPVIHVPHSARARQLQRLGF
jgi:hypothetical protein